MTDDEVLARLRLSLHTIAERTPISSGRSTTLAALADQSPARSLVTVFSAAAAVAAMVAVAAVVANAHSGNHGSVRPGAGGPGLGLASSKSPVASVAPTPPSKPTPVAGAVAGSAVPQHSPGRCVPENYYVVASAAEVEGLTYMLPATPAGYRLYGAWGTISRNHCADSVTWYVEYDPVSGPANFGSLQLTVTKVGDTAAGDARATPVAATPITVGGTEGSVIEKDGVYALIGWAVGGAQIALAGPVSHGDHAALVKLADSLVLLRPDDPRIVAPANCHVPAGSTCPSPPTITPTPNPTG